MENTENKPADSKEPVYAKFKGFFADRYSFAFAIVLAFAFAIRLYYFFLTKSQPVWWDESEYLGMAKHWAFGTFFNFNTQRLPVMPLLAAAIYKLGGGVATIKFFLSVLPSVGIVGLFYALGTKMYEKRVGLLAAVMAAVFWVPIFWTNRVNTDMLAFLFALAGVYFMWVGLITKEYQKSVYYVLPLFTLAFLTKPNYILLIISAFVFLLCYLRTELLKTKGLLFSALLAAPIFISFLVWQKLKFGSLFAFRTATYVLTPTRETLMSARGVGWHVLNFVYLFPEKVFFWIFLLGFVLALFYVAIGRDLIRKDKALAANLFLIILFAVVLVYFVFIERDAEDRWVLPIALTIFFFAAFGLEQIRRWLSKVNKVFALLVVVALLMFGSYVELSRADTITKIKIETYAQEPVAGAWLKERTSPGDTIIANNEQVPFIYYTERKVVGVEEDFMSQINRLKPKYYVVTGYFPSPQWTYELPLKYKSSVAPVQGFYDVRNGQKVLMIAIYEFTE